MKKLKMNDFKPRKRIVREQTESQDIYRTRHVKY